MFTLSPRHPLASQPPIQSSTPNESSAASDLSSGPAKATLTARQRRAHAFGDVKPLHGPSTPSELPAEDLKNQTGPRGQPRQSPSKPRFTSSSSSSTRDKSQSSTTRSKTFPYAWHPSTSDPFVIFDPDFPDGTPSCLAPRGQSASVKAWLDKTAESPMEPMANAPISTKLSPPEGRLTVSEISKFGHVGTVDEVWGPELPELGWCTCSTQNEELCPLHVWSMERGPTAKSFDPPAL